MTTSERLREHPHERLAAPVQIVDLATESKKLRAEPHDAVDGHRQIAVVREGPVTVILFAFDTGGHLPEHETDGQVTIHTLAGRLEVTADGTAHTLHAGQLLALAPKIRHRVSAAARSQMLLTIHKREARDLPT